MINFYFDQLNNPLWKKTYSKEINHLNKLILQQSHGGMLCFIGTVSFSLPHSNNFFLTEKIT